MRSDIRNYFENLPAYRENPFPLDDSDSLIDLGLIDSFGIIEFVLFLEKTFKFEIDEEDLIQKNFESINAIEKFINEKRNGQHSAKLK